MGTLELIVASIVFLISLFLVLHFFFKGGLLAPTFVGLYYVFHIVMHLSPSLYFLLTPGYNYAHRYFWACIITCFLIPLGGLLAYFVLAPYFRNVQAYNSLPLDSSGVTLRRCKYFVYCCGFLATALVIVYAKTQPAYPFKAMLLGMLSNSEIVKLRLQSSRGFLYGPTLLFFMPFVFGSSFAMWRFLRSFASRLLLLLFMGMAFFYASYTSRKTPVVLLFLVCFIIHAFRRGMRPSHQEQKVRNFSRRHWVAAVLLAVMVFAYPIFVFKFKPFGKEESVTYILLRGILARIFLTPATNSYYAFEVFPEKHDFTYFTDLYRVCKLFGLKYIDLSQFISLYKGQPEYNDAPPTSIGNFYAQLGWPGLVLQTLFTAFMFQFLQVYFTAKKRKTPLHEPIYALLLYASFRVNFADLSTVLLSEIVIPSLPFIFLVNLLSRRRQAPAAPGMTAPQFALGGEKI